MQLVSSAVLCATTLAGLAEGIRMVKKAQQQRHETRCDWANGEHYNLTYPCGPGCKQKYDLLTTKAAYPVDVATPVPLAVFVHGGSWSGGDKRSGVDQKEFAALRQRGMHVASINYRLTPNVRHPLHAQDVESALIHFKKPRIAEKYNIDPKKVFLIGSSAGGHLVSLVGTWQQLGKQARPAAVVDFYGPVLLYWQIPSARQRSSVTNMLGCDTPAKEDTACHETAKEASAVTHVSAGSPPFLIFQGDKDASYNASVELKKAGDEAGADYTFVNVTCPSRGTCHSRDAMFQATTQVNDAAVCNVDFMYSWLYEKLNWHATGCQSCPFFER